MRFSIDLITTVEYATLDEALAAGHKGIAEGYEVTVSESNGENHTKKLLTANLATGPIEAEGKNVR